MKLYIIGVLLAFLVVGCQVVPVEEILNETTNESIEETTNEVDNETESETVLEPSTDPVVDTNDLPTYTFREGDVVQVRQDIAYDPDGGEITYTFSAPLDESGRWQTEIGDAGTYIITITASDGRL